MVKHYRNNACVMLWSSGNEVWNQVLPDGIEIVTKLQDLFHQLDPTRPVTNGMDQAMYVIHNGFGAAVELPGFNYRTSRYEEAYENLPQKMILGSETASTVSSRGVYKIPAVLKDFAIYHNETYKLSFDKSSETFEAFFITCANADQWGNNAFIAPTASLRDGLLDVIAAHPFSVVDAPLIAFQLFNKQIDRNPNVSVRKCRRLTITRDSEGSAHFDGEPVTLGREIHIELVPSGLNVLIPDKRRGI